MAIKYSNNAKTTVSVAGITGTTINVVDASTFPDIDSVDDYTYITLLAGSTAQIFKAIAIDLNNNVITVDVAPDSAVFVPNSTRVELRLTAELLSGLMDTHEHTLEDITGVTLSTPTQDQVLAWNGAAWTNAAPTGSEGGTIGNSLDGGNAAGVFDGVSGGSSQGVTIYNTPADLSLAPLVVGDMAYVVSLIALYTCTGTSWASVALSNAAPIVASITQTIDDVYGINPNTGLLWDANYPGYSDITVDVTDPDGTIPTITILSSNLEPSTTVTKPLNNIFRLVATADEIGKIVVVRVSDGTNYTDHTISVSMRDEPFVPPVAGQQLFEGALSTQNYTFTVPAYALSVSAIVVGGGGHGGYTLFGSYSGSPGDRGGIAIGTLPVTPGEILSISVGPQEQSSTIKRGSTTLLEATGGTDLSRGSPQHYNVSPSSGSGYFYYGSYTQAGEAGINTLTMAGGLAGKLSDGSTDPNAQYVGGAGGMSYHMGLSTSQSSNSGYSGDHGVIRILWGYTDSTNATLRSFPSTGIGNY